MAAHEFPPPHFVQVAYDTNPFSTPPLTSSQTHPPTLRILHTRNAHTADNTRHFTPDYGAQMPAHQTTKTETQQRIFKRCTTSASYFSCKSNDNTWRAPCPVRPSDMSHAPFHHSSTHTFATSSYRIWLQLRRLLPSTLATPSVVSVPRCNSVGQVHLCLVSFASQERLQPGFVH